MAERDSQRDGRSEEGAADPFADLARIIGFDPRVKVPPTQAAPVPQPPVAEPFAKASEPVSDDLDLEHDFADFQLDLDEPARQEAGAPSVEPTVEAGEAEAPVVASTAPESFDEEPAPLVEASAQDAHSAADFDAVTEAFERASEQTAQLSAEIDETARKAPVQREEPDESPEDEFLASLVLLPDEPEPKPAQPADSLDAALDDVLAASIERDLGDAWLHSLDHPELPETEPESTVPEAEKAAPEPAFVAPPPAAEVPVEAAAEAELEEPVAASAAAIAQAPVEAEADFEDELRALLEGGPAQAHPEQVQLEQAHPEQVHAAALHGQHVEVEASAPMALADPVPVAEEPPPVVEAAVAEEPAEEETVLTETGPPEPDPEPASVPEPAASEPPAVEPESRQSARPAALPLDAKELDDDPFAALAAMAERYRAGRPAALPSRPPAPVVSQVQEKVEVEPMKRTPAGRYEQPEIETVDVPERAVALADDLDIPETEFETPASRNAGRGNVDAEFADLLEEMSSGEPARQSNYRARQDAYFEMPQREAPARARQPEPKAAPAAASAEDEWQPEQPYNFDEGVFEKGDTEIADESQTPRKRGRWLSALFGCVVLAGGAGAVAMKYTGIAEVGGPIVVVADASPMKMRPDNPGGSVVPNQDNEVYDRVSGNAGVTPSQEKLLSSAEEPVSLDESAFDDGSLPGLDMGEEIEMEPAAKSEERVEAEAAEEPHPSELPIAVVPRKVRTVAVRADGTIVQAEEEKPPVEALVASAGEAIDTVRNNEVGVDTTGSTTAAITPDAQDDAPAAPAQAEKIAAIQPAMVDEPAAAGAWSVQIASQPSEEAARSSYSDLAQRYGAVLGGRNVNIVKAEIAGKGTFWRVRVPAETRTAAVDLCTSYKAAGGNCFVSK